MRPMKCFNFEKISNFKKLKFKSNNFKEYSIDNCRIIGQTNYLGINVHVYEGIRGGKFYLSRKGLKQYLGSKTFTLF